MHRVHAWVGDAITNGIFNGFRQRVAFCANNGTGEAALLHRKLYIDNTVVEDNGLFLQTGLRMIHSGRVVPVNVSLSCSGSWSIIATLILSQQRLE